MTMKMKQLLLATWAVVALAIPVRAQQTIQTISTTVCPDSNAAAGCAVFGAIDRASIGIQVQGTFVGTLQFEQTIDNINWVSWSVTPFNSTTAVTSATATGLWTGPVTNFKIRVRFSAYTSGSAVVTKVSTVSSRGGGSSGGGGAGNPAGDNLTLQFNSGGVFGGATPWKFTGANAITSTATGTWFLNAPVDTTSGNFEQVIGVASNDVPPGDTRPDHVASMGWNASGAATGNAPNGTGIGSNQLTFESYCSFGTGCLAGDGGQSETYFAMGDGKGSNIRPLGFFQQKFQNDIDHFLYTISRSDEWGFWDRDFTYEIMSLDDNAGVGGIRTFDSLISSTITSGTLISISGNEALGLGENVEVGRAGGVDLGPGGDASGEVRVMTNHFQLASTTIEATGNDGVRIALGAGDAGQHPVLANSAGNVLYTAAGTTGNIDLEFLPKGNGNTIINFGGSSSILRAYPHPVLGYNTGGVTSTTANSCGTTAPSIAGGDAAGKVTVGATSGTSCTVTFGFAWTFAPACMANNETTANLARATSTTTTVILKGVFVAGDVISYICIGGQ